MSISKELGILSFQKVLFLILEELPDIDRSGTPSFRMTKNKPRFSRLCRRASRKNPGRIPHDLLHLIAGNANFGLIDESPILTILVYQMYGHPGDCGIGWNT